MDPRGGPPHRYFTRYQAGASGVADKGEGSISVTMVFQAESKQIKTHTPDRCPIAKAPKPRVNLGPLFGILLADHLLNEKKIKTYAKAVKLVKTDLIPFVYFCVVRMQIDRLIACLMPVRQKNCHISGPSSCHPSPSFLYFPLGRQPSKSSEPSHSTMGTWPIHRSGILPHTASSSSYHAAGKTGSGHAVFHDGAPHGEYERL